MAEFTSSGQLLDWVIAFTLLEVLVLVVYHRRTGRGVAPALLIANVASGLCLMLALRAALAQAAWPWIVLPLAASGVAHATDLYRRWQR